VVLCPIPPSQRTKMLIDIALVPVGVANRRQVEKLNAVFDRLSARRVDKIMLPELGSGWALASGRPISSGSRCPERPRDPTGSVRQPRPCRQKELAGPSSGYSAGAARTIPEPASPRADAGIASIEERK
jgi:hypothetical protein